MNRSRRLFAALATVCGLMTACSSTPVVTAPVVEAPSGPVIPPPPVLPKVALALGGGAARGFAHVGVIKMLESQGIQVDLIIGTSAGSVVGALYASGLNGFELQEMTFDLERATFADWQLFNRGLLRGEKLQNFVNEKVGNRKIQQLPRRFAAVAAKLRTGEATVFTTGDVGLAVRASSAIPGVFQPAVIDNEEYVDGGTVSPVPVRFARTLGADIVIAVDVSAPVEEAREDSTLGTVLKAFDIMGSSLRRAELPGADVVIAPDVHGIKAADFESKQRAILAGEKAALAAVPAIRALIAAKTH
ncbi:patatin-like phospholipase family protein [Nevskia sp.]|uniref:patatin-like phospholipase family protein n=1 Tax=Nevskia sp. TaxID=1929292 RepID=UPI0025DB38C9|nr:patatin-like phospholipase family protein [Nevskia sp.]